MNATRQDNVAVAEVAPLQPANSPDENSVVFRGDGEPKTPRGLLRQLSEFDAAVGLEPDNYSLGGTVEALERRFAEMLGQEAAIFMPTGTLANHLAIRRHCGVKPRAVIQEQSHIYNDTGDSVTRLSGINLVPLAKDRPHFTLDELSEAVTMSVSGRVLNEIGAVVIESPVRRQDGQVVPYDVMREITGFCRERGIPTHLDGARLYMMSAATGVSPSEYAALFDTTYVSLYKYFGAPFGAALAGSSAFVEGLYHERRLFGGGLPAVYMAAAPALSGMEGFEERFGAAMKQAGALFDMLNTLPAISVKSFEHGSNIFPVEFASEVDVERLVSALSERNVFVYPQEANPRRLLLTVNTTILRQTNDAIFSAFSEALG